MIKGRALGAEIEAAYDANFNADAGDRSWSRALEGRGVTTRGRLLCGPMAAGWIQPGGETDGAAGTFDWTPRQGPEGGGLPVLCLGVGLGLNWGYRLGSPPSLLDIVAFNSRTPGKYWLRVGAGNGRWPVWLNEAAWMSAYDREGGLILTADPLQWMIAISNGLDDAVCLLDAGAESPRDVFGAFASVTCIKGDGTADSDLANRVYKGIRQRVKTQRLPEVRVPPAGEHLEAAE